MHKFIYSTAIVAALGLAVSPVTPAERVSHSHLLELFPGTFAARYKGYDLKIVARANGRLQGYAAGQEDTGRWSIVNGKLCIMFEDWLEGDTKCSTVRRSAKWLVANDVKFKRI